MPAGTVLAGLLACLGVYAAPTGTIADLEMREIEVVRDPPAGMPAQQAIEQYRRFLELESGNDALRAEAMRRLGDLQLEVEDAHGLDPAAWSGARLDEAIALYQGLLDQYPDYDRGDAVMYQLARAYETKGEPEQALAVLDRLVRRHPDSAWAIESQFRRGEIRFGMARYHDAEEAYAAVVAAGPVSGFHEQGLYKHGWSLFKQGRGEESVQSFLTLLDGVLIQGAVLRPREALSRPERELGNDALRAMAITFSDLGGPRTLDATLAQRGDPAYAHRLYEALGDLYMEKERYQDAAQAYEAFAIRRPDGRYAPSLQMRAIEAYQKGGFASLVLDGKRAFVERYAFGSAFWRQRGVDDAPEVAAQLRSNLEDLAAYHHAQAQTGAQKNGQGNQASKDYAAAVRWYRDLLDFFPRDADAPATRFLLAEALFEAGRFAEAAREYERTAYEYPPQPRSAEAGYAGLIAYERHERTIDGEARAAWHRQGIESALMFSNSFPDHAQAAQVLTAADEDLFALGEFDRVMEVSAQILALDPPVSAAHRRTAATLLAHSLFDRGRYDEAEAAYLQVQGLLVADDPAHGDIEERIAASIYKQAEEKKAQGDAAGAVEDFLRVGVLAPRSQARASAEYDAAGILVELEQWERAAPVLEAFRRDHPQHELVPQAERALALAYLETGRPMQAAAEFARISAHEHEAPEVRRAALWQAAELYETSAATTQAARLYAQYVEQYPSPLDAAMDARQKLVDMAQASNDLQAQTRWSDDIIRADRDAGAARTPRSRYLAARATFAAVQPKVAVFNAIKLVAPLDQALGRKRLAMEKAMTAYGEALDYGIAEITTAATFGMAELYRQLGADLLASERPADLQDEALEQYDVLLEEQAFPFEEKAIELHEANARRASDGVYDEWVQRSFDVLAKLVPARYAKAEMDEGYVSTLPQAEEALRAAVGRNDGNAPAFNQLGILYRRLGRFAEAETAYRRALEVDPGYAIAHLNLGVLCDLYLQQPRCALDAYERYLALASPPDARVSGWVKDLRMRLGAQAGGNDERGARS